MKKFLNLMLCAVCALSLFSSCYDDSALKERLDDHEDRIASLETFVKQMNNDIASLQTLVKALENNDYVTSVDPVVSGGQTIGYTINFSKSKAVTIYNGTDGANGADGETPRISVRKDTDGNYYWTCNGEWLLDDKGAKIRANGLDGEDGTNGVDGEKGEKGEDAVAPQLKIEDGYWYISTDNGSTWTQLGKAQGEDGKDGGDSLFKTVTVNEDAIVFILKDDSEIVIPRIPTFALKCLTNDCYVDYSQPVELPYAVNGAAETDDVVVYVFFVTEGWKAEIEATSAVAGNLKITAPVDATSGLVIAQAVNNSTGATSTQAIRVQNGFVEVDTTYETIGSEGGEITVNLTTNFDVYSVECSKDWVSLKPATKGVHTDALVFVVEANTGEARAAAITIKGATGEEAVIAIEQEESPAPIAVKTGTYYQYVWSDDDDDYLYVAENERTLEVYNGGRYVIKSFLGEEGYDLVFVDNGDGSISLPDATDYYGYKLIYSGSDPLMISIDECGLVLDDEEYGNYVSIEYWDKDGNWCYDEFDWDVPEASVLSYESYIGNWTVTTTGSTTGEDITFQIGITAKEDGSTYNVRGWSSLSDMDDYLDYFIIEANYDAETGWIYFMNNQATYLTSGTCPNDNSTVNCYMLSKCLVTTEGDYYGKSYLVTGNFVSILGCLSDDGSITLYPASVTLSNGLECLVQSYDLYGICDQHIWNLDNNYGLAPYTLTKAPVVASKSVKTNVKKPAASVKISRNLTNAGTVMSAKQ